MGENKDYITHIEDKGSINISEDVVAKIAAHAVLEVDGVAGMFSSKGGEIVERLGKKSTSKGVKIQLDEAGITVDVYVVFKLDFAVNDVAAKIQENVISALEPVTGFKVNAVNVNVCGIALK